MGLFNTIRMGSSAAGDYEVERSLKFNDDDTAYLNRTFGSAGNRKTYTISAWVKIGNLGTTRPIFNRYTGNSDAGFLGLYVNSDDFIYFTGWSTVYLKSSRIYRDPTAWSHILLAVDTTQSTSTDRIKLYFNGELQTLATYNAPSQDADLVINEAVEHRVGNYHNVYFDGYMAELNFVDGSALTPSSFGKTDTITGQWNPKKYVGSYGTNGFYLNFSDNSGTTATTLGKDSSGNGNNFTPNNFSVAAGVGNDSLTDTPTNNFCTFNPLKVNPSAPIVFSEGLLQHNGVSGNNHLRSATTMQVTSGKWYVEFKFVSGYETTDSTVRFGICTDAGHRDSNNDATWYQNTDNFLAIQYGNNGTVYRSETGTNTSELTGLSTFVNGDVMGIALDLDNDKFFVSKNGTFFSNGTGTQDPANGTNPLYSGGVLTSRKSDGFYFNISGYSAQVVTADFGQHGYAYTPPTGFKAVNTANLSAPTILLPNKYFDTKLWTGANTANSRDITGLEFQPDWVWIKARNQSSYGGGLNYHHMVWDSVRGVGSTSSSSGKDLATNENYPESSSSTYSNLYGHVSAFNSDGFTVQKASGEPAIYTDYGSTNYVAWSWNAGGSTATNNDGSRTTQVRANTTAGFSIVTSTSGGSSSGTYDSFGHGLGVAPDIILFKNRDISDNWSIYNSNFSTAYSKILQFNTIVETTSSNHWGTANPTSTTFSINQGAVFTGADQNLVAYCFSEVAGYSKFGKYTGNGNANGTFVFTGFRPAWVMMKRVDASGNWFIIDNKRDPFNEVTKDLQPNSAGAEVDNTNFLDFLSNGFKLRTTGTSVNSGTIAYLAFAESPFKNSRAR